MTPQSYAAVIHFGHLALKVVQTIDNELIVAWRWCWMHH